MTKYRFIDTQKAFFPIFLLLRVLDIKKSAYYRWHSSGRDNYVARQNSETVLVGEISEIHQEYKASYRAPRIRVALTDQGVTVSKRRVAEVMARNGITGDCGRVKDPKTTNPGCRRSFPDLVNRRFLAAKPNTVWYGDITYIRVGDGFQYLATVIDACTKEVVGWSFEDHMETSLVTDALRHALRRRGTRNCVNVIFHSDRGSHQYLSDDMNRFCRANRIRQSTGRRATCFDNAAAESWFATIKRELISRRVWGDPVVLRFEIFEWIEGWYNTRRIHTSIGNIPPAQAYQHHQAELIKTG